MKKSETSFTKDVKLPTQNSQSPNIDMLKEMNKSTDMISSLIHEYLLKKEYYKSLDAFQEDLAQKLIHKNYYRPSFQEVSENVLIKLVYFYRVFTLIYYIIKRACIACLG